LVPADVGTKDDFPLTPVSTFENLDATITIMKTDLDLEPLFETYFIFHFNSDLQKKGPYQGISSLFTMFRGWKWRLKARNAPGRATCYHMKQCGLPSWEGTRFLAF
jgi:hypothetical protein